MLTSYLIVRLLKQIAIFSIAGTQYKCLHNKNIAEMEQFVRTLSNTTGSYHIP